MSCGDPPASTGTPFKANTPWDPDGDGVSNGTYIDNNGDGIADGIDTDGDGNIDLNVYGNPLGSGDGDGDSRPSTGNGDGNSNGDGDNDGNCQEQIIKNDRIPPDMLIVLDRSGSMKMNNTNRWDPSVMALESVTSQLSSGISFGLMSFPANNDQCAAGKLDVPIAANNSAAINTALMGMKPNGGTPTSITLAAAHKLLGQVSSDPDAIVTPKYVLLVTDGEPNCTNPNKCPVPSGFDLQALADYVACLSAGDSGAIADTVAEIKSMANDGIKTYVVGYDTDTGSVKQTMDMMAAAGGTGETSHIAVKNGDELTKALETIAGKAASCTILLEQEVSDPRYVLVTIDDAQMLALDQKDGNGFTVDKDNRTVTIQGTSCDTLRDTKIDHKVHVQVQCEPVLF